jgi:hypothetical protein
MKGKSKCFPFSNDALSTLSAVIVHFTELISIIVIDLSIKFKCFCFIICTCFFFIEAAMGIQVNAQLEDSEYLNAVQKYTPFLKHFLKNWCA